MPPGLGQLQREGKTKAQPDCTPHLSPLNQQKDCKPPSRAAPLLPEHSQINPTGNAPALFKQVSGLWETSLWQALGLPQSRRLQEFQSRNCLPKRRFPSAASPLWVAAILPAHPSAKVPLLLQPNPGCCSLCHTHPNTPVIVEGHIFACFYFFFNLFLFPTCT